MVSVLPMVVLVLALGACGDEERPGRAATTVASSGPFDGVMLTEELGCGFGFSQSDEAEEVLLSVQHSGGSAKVGRTVSFPDPGWEAEVRVGSHLAANWCSDVIVPPEPEVEETWRIVEGTLRFEGEVPPFDWSEPQVDRPVRAELTGVVLEGPDGERAELRALSLSNDAWGLFAG